MVSQIEANSGRELKALRLLIDQTREGVLAFSLYSDVSTREEAADWLRNQSSVPIEVVRLSSTVTDLGEIIRPFSPAPRRCFLFFDIEAGFPNVLGYVNLHRELLLQFGHALVFWIREEGMRRIAGEAPDFWAWRSNVFDFRTSSETPLGPTGPHDAVIGQYDKAQLEEQVRSLEQSGRSDLGSHLAIGRRQLVLRRFQEADKALQQAVSEAERQDDKRSLAEALFLFGNSKLEQELLEQAQPLYARSMEIARQIGSKEVVVAGVRQLSAMGQKLGDLDSAYKLAGAMTGLAEATGSPTALASAYDQLGNVLFARRDLRGAEQAYLTAVKYEEQLNHRFDLAHTLAKLRTVYKEMGAASQAEAVAQRATSLFRELGLESAEAQAVLQRMPLEFGEPKPPAI